MRLFIIVKNTLREKRPQIPQVSDTYYTGLMHNYSWGLSTVTIEYSCPSVCLSVLKCFNIVTLELFWRCRRGYYF